MDDRLRICLWMLGGGVFGGVLGGGFGALAAALYARSGGAAGTRLARRVVDNFLRFAESQPTPTGRAALIGAADGYLFLGILGLIIGILLGVSGWTVEELWMPMIVGTGLLIGGAVFFGTLAYSLANNAVEFHYAVALGFLSCFPAAMLLGPDFFFVGIGPGMFVGLFSCRAVRAYSPRFHLPRIEKTIPQQQSDSNTNITGPQPSPARDDIFHKLDSIIEHYNEPEA